MAGKPIEVRALVDDIRRDQAQLSDPDGENVLEAIITALGHKREMLATGERQRVADCPRCGGSLRLALIGPKNHLRMFCRGNATDPEDTPHCGMNLME